LAGTLDSSYSPLLHFLLQGLLLSLPGVMNLLVLLKHCPGKIGLAARLVSARKLVVNATVPVDRQSRLEMRYRLLRFVHGQVSLRKRAVRRQ
jgi:hypothetical protein